MSKQRVLSILAKSQDRQRNIDTMVQTILNLDVDGGHFHHHVKTVMKSSVDIIINDLRSIEYLLFLTTGGSYTQETYSSGSDTPTFLPPNRSFTSVEEAIAFYKTYIAEITAEITAEHIETLFIGDSEGQGNDDNNTVYAKSAHVENGLHWADFETEILSELNTIQTLLNHETVDFS
ncbi:MAG TPA: hypothetical protein ACFYEK_01050 [Candidatus Wunengus sp. YC60]|uniref:hypothetical protein n=1 Tax=Candidatus Wunengus sp. YC60 TaxID=3367697 RepID=UPI004024C0A6